MIKFKSILAIFILSPLLFFISCDPEELPHKISNCLLIYMSAENSLSYYVEEDLNELKQGFIPDYFENGKSGDVLLIYINTIASKEDNGKPKLYRLSKEKTGDINQELIQEYEEHNSNNDSVMNSVLTYAANLFPAERNGLIFWSHGTGWLPSRYYSNPYSINSKGKIVQSAVIFDPYASLVRSFGDYEQEIGTKKEMEITDLAAALPIRYSLILFDACFMGGIEVAYQLKNKTDYLISSSAEIMAGGFPYQYMGELFFKTKTGAKTGGLEELCKRFYDYYNEQGLGATISLIKSSALPELAEACLNIFLTRRIMIPDLERDSIQGFFRNDRHYFYDLGDFISRIALPDQYSVYEKAMNTAVICKYATEHFGINPYQTIFDIKKFSGLSTYIQEYEYDLEENINKPSNKVLDDFYKSLDWNKAVQMIR